MHHNSRKRLASLATLRLALCASRRISCLQCFRTVKVLRSARAGESERAKSEAPVSDPASQRELEPVNYWRERRVAMKECARHGTPARALWAERGADDPPWAVCADSASILALLN